MFKRISKSEWRQREEVRLRVERLRASVNRGHPSSMVQVRVPIRRRPTGARRRFKITRGLLGRLWSLVRSGRA